MDASVGTLSRAGDAEFELADIKDYDLPLLDEPMSAIFDQCSNDHTKTWSAKIASFRRVCLRDAGIQPWHVGRVEERDRLPLQSGTTENLRLVLGELMVADVRAQAALSL